MTISNYDLWLGTPPDDGYDPHDDLDLIAHNTLVADLAEQDASQCGGFGCVDGCIDCIDSDVIPAANTPLGTRYRVLDIPGTELCEDADKRGCEWCGITHPIQTCPAIRAELMKGETR
jgi:hypothetical protein